MNNYKTAVSRFGGFLLGIMLMVSPAAAGADTLSDIQAQINALIAQVKALQAQLQLVQLGDGSFCFRVVNDHKIGDQGEEVKILQQALTKLGYYNGAINGIFGESTASALVAFQEANRATILTPNGLSRGTGYLGAASRRVLTQRFPCTSTTNPTDVVLKQMSASNPTRYSNQAFTIDWKATGPANAVLHVSCSRGIKLYSKEDNRTYSCSSSKTRLARYSMQSGNSLTLVPKEVSRATTATFYLTLENDGSLPNKMNVSVNLTSTEDDDDDVLDEFDIIYPAGGETFTQGVTYQFKWNNVRDGTNSYTVYLVKGLTNGGSNIIKTIGTLYPSSPRLSWKIPTDVTPGSGYQISYVGYNSGGKTGGISNTFSIAAPANAAPVINEISSRGYSDNEIEAGKLVYISCTGCLASNTLWIGATAVSYNNSGSVTIPASIAAGTYEVYIVNNNGTSNKRSVKVYAAGASTAPVLNSVTISPSPVPSGQEATVTFSATGASYYKLYLGCPLAVSSGTSVCNKWHTISGGQTSFKFTPVNAETYAIPLSVIVYAYSSGDVSSTPLDKTVSVSAPVVAVTPTCTLAKNKTSYLLNETITLSWTSTNAAYTAFEIPFGQGGLSLPTGTLSTSGIKYIPASYAGDHVVTLRAYGESAAYGTCSVTIPVANATSNWHL